MMSVRGNIPFLLLGAYTLAASSIRQPTTTNKTLTCELAGHFFHTSVEGDIISTRFESTTPS